MTEAQGRPLIAVRGVSKRYDHGQVEAVRDVTLEVEAGKILTVVGPSGSGKSTLLHLMGGLDRPSAGEVWFEDEQPRSRRRWAHLRATRIGFIFQSFHLIATMTAQQNVEMAMFGRGRSPKDRARRACELLERVGLARRASHRPPALSVGERQRVATARSLANSPIVLLADEPTGNLDSQSRREVVRLLLEIHAAEGMTIILVTHDHGLASLGHRRLEMLDGSVVADYGSSAATAEKM